MSTQTVTASAGVDIATLQRTMKRRPSPEQIEKVIAAKREATNVDAEKVVAHPVKDYTTYLVSYRNLPVEGKFV